jgi:hypothetical protein
LTQTTGDSDVLLVIDHERDWRTHAARLIRRDIEKFFTGVGAIGDEVSIVGSGRHNALEDKISSRRESPAADAAAALHAPLFFLRRRIDSDKPVARIELAVLIDRTHAR